jgi:hypothetical protein
VQLSPSQFVAEFLRHINRSKWYRHDGVAWLRRWDLQADALADLYTKNNALSVYYVPNRGMDLDRLITAIAARRDVPTHFDYVLIDAATITALSIGVAVTLGNTPDAVANALHRDLIELTRDKLSGLVSVISLREHHRVLPGEVKARLLRAVADGNLDMTEINAQLRQHLER